MNDWTVKIGSKAEKELLLAIQDGRLTADDQEVIKSWVEEIEDEGFEAIENSKFWNDHALEGSWNGFRSSSFSKLGRIIYRVEDEQIIIEVVRITTDHNYRNGDL